MSVELPTQAQVVVVGGGIIGASVAYHLTKRGITDVLLLEQGKLTGGTTWHAAGLVSQLKPTHSLTKLATYSNRLFQELEAETGQATGYRAPGSISVASDAERWEEMRRGISMASTVGVEIREIEMDELTDKVPLLRTDDLVGALYIPNDGQTSPVDTTMSLIKGARQGGATVIEGVSVQRLLKDGDRCTGIETEEGHVIEAETVVMAAGMWTRHLAETIGVNVPLQACEHFYIVTEPLEGAERGMPIVRDPNNYTYFKEETGKIMAGFFEPKAKIWNLDGIPRDFCFGTLPEDWNHLGPIFEAACRRMPALADAGLQLFFNGPEAFTPDGTFYLGESPEVDRCFVAAGFNSVGIQTAGGVGWVLADWIVDGYPPMDLSAADIRRSFSFQSDRSYLEARISESLGLLYAMHWPFRQYESARGVRKSSLHEVLEKAGAVFGETAGWERPNWFAPEGVEQKDEWSFRRSSYYEHVGNECKNTAINAGLLDMTAFAKCRVQGPGALKFLNWIFAQRMPVAHGKLALCHGLTSKGGVHSEFTIQRESKDSFYMVSAGANHRLDHDWLKKHMPADGSVQFTDLTNSMGVLVLAGPKSRDILQPITGANLSNECFPWLTGQETHVGYAPVKLLRVNFVGELGWEIHHPIEYQNHIFDSLFTHGDKHGLKPFGIRAMNSMRLEKSYRLVGTEMSIEYSAYESGLHRFVNLKKKNGFLGKDALLEWEKRGFDNAFVTLEVIDVDDADVIGNNPIYNNNEVVGRATSGGYGWRMNKSLALAMVHPDQSKVGNELSIEILGKRYKCKVLNDSPHDPENEKLRS